MEQSLAAEAAAPPTNGALDERIRRRVADEASSSLQSVLSPGRFDVLDDAAGLTELERLEREVEAQHAALVRIGYVPEVKR